MKWATVLEGAVKEGVNLKKILQLYSNSTFGTVMNQDQQTVNVNLTTQTKVNFDYFKDINIRCSSRSCKVGHGNN